MIRSTIIFILLFLSTSNVFAVTSAYTNRCGMPFLIASQSCSRTPPSADCAALATTCATGCADMTGFNASEREPPTAPRRKDQCIAWGGTVSPTTGAASTGAAARCDAATTMLTNTSVTPDSAALNTCLEDCNIASAEAATDDLRIRYSNTASTCSDKLGATAPVDPIPEDSGETVAEDSTGDTGGSTTGDLPVADTGSPNTNALNGALTGLGGTTTGLRPIDPGRGVNFRGSGGSKGSYGEVANGVGAIGAPGGDVLPALRIDDVVASGAGPKVEPADFGGGGNGGGGSGGGGGGPMGGAARPGGGGARTSVAGAQLAKQGTNQFWAGGSGAAPTGAKAAARATATALKVPLVEKPKFGPEYLSKGTGSSGLLRLWGAGMNKLPVDRGSQSCRDQTIFCNLENFDFEFKP